MAAQEEMVGPGRRGIFRVNKSSGFTFSKQDLLLTVAFLRSWSSLVDDPLENMQMSVDYMTGTS